VIYYYICYLCVILCNNKCVPSTVLIIAVPVFSLYSGMVDLMVFEIA
jgi:hypothetical protein